MSDLTPTEINYDSPGNLDGPAAESTVSPNAEPIEPCPTPLEWQEIVQICVRDADHWYFETDGMQIRGRTWGTGPPLYFLNGLSGSHELYALSAYLLQEDYRCVLFDYPEPRTTSVSELSQLVSAIATQQGDETISLFGAGFGTLVAWQTATQFPQLVDRIVAQSPLVTIELSLLERLLAGVGRFVPGRFSRVPTRWNLLQRSHRVWFPPFDDSRFQFYVDNTGYSITRAVAGRFRAGGQFDASSLLPDITQPVLLVRTEGEGPVQQEAADKLEQTLPKAQSEWMHTSGLLPFLTHPHRLAKLIRQFLTPDTSAENLTSHE